MKNYLVFSAAVLGLLACDERPYGTNSPPILRKIPSIESGLRAAEGDAAPQASSWNPTANDITGRWQKTCYSLERGGLYAREEIFFDDDLVQHVKVVYGDAACTETRRVKSTVKKLAFEEGWDDDLLTLHGATVGGWKGIYRDEDDAGFNGDPVDYRVIAHLAEEDGKRVLYIHWTELTNKVFDPIQDRYEFLE